MVKKTEFIAYNTPIKADGIIAINIRDDDELVAVRRVDGGDDDHHGLALGPGRRASTRTSARAMGRDTAGVRGMNVSRKDNAVLAMDVARDDQELLVVTENGYGKRTGDRPSTARPAAAPRASRRSSSPRRRARSPARSSCASTRSSSSSRTSGMVQRTGVRGISRYGPRVAGRAGHEHAATTTACQRGRAGHGVRGARRPPRSLEEAADHPVDMSADSGESVPPEASRDGASGPGADGDGEA